VPIPLSTLLKNSFSSRQFTQGAEAAIDREETVGLLSRTLSNRDAELSFSGAR